MTSRNLISAIFIAVHLALTLVFLYVVIPLLPQMLWVILSDADLPHGPETNGIGIVVFGGISEWVAGLVAAAPILFALVFVLLRKRRRSSIALSHKAEN